MLKGRCRVEGIAHLVPERIDREYPEDQIRRKAGYLSRLYVLGTSLRTYFVQKGIPVEKSYGNVPLCRYRILHAIG